MSGAKGSASSSADYKSIGKYAIGALAVAGVAATAVYLYKKAKATDSKAAADNKAAGASKVGPQPWPSATYVSPSGAADAITLSNGQKCPTIAFGTLCSAGDKAEQIADAVRDALHAGYRHIDCAAAYNNEKQIGDVFRDVLVYDADGVTAAAPAASAAGAAAGGLRIKRRDLFVTSKLWGTEWDDVRSACLTTLENLQCQYLDLYLVHWPFENCPVSAAVRAGDQLPPEHTGYSVERYAQVWRQMEQLVADGLVRAIGVSNMTVAKLKALLQTAKIKPAANQIEVHPYLAQPALVQYCKSQGILVTGYFVIGSARRAAFMRADTDPVLLDDPAVVAVARDAKATPAQVLIAWALQRGTVPIVKALSPARIRENWNAYGVALTSAQVARLDALDRDFRYLNASLFAWPATTPWRDLWDNEHVAKP